MKLFLSYILFLLMVSNCKHDKKKIQITLDESQKISNTLVKKSKKNIKILTLKEAIANYGSFSNSNQFKLNTANLNEFRIELNNFFNIEQLNSEIEIREITWKNKPDSLLTAWYKKNNKKWIYVHSIVYHKNDEF